MLPLPHKLKLIYMDKTDSIINYIINLPKAEQVDLHNKYCQVKSLQENIIYPLNEDNIDTYFGRAIYLFQAMRNNKSFDINAEFFYASDNQVSTNIDDIINIDEIVEFIIDWGDYHFPLKTLNEHLEKHLIKYAYDLVCDKFSYEEIEEIITSSSADYLMDDWYDIVRELFNLVGTCPDCKTAIYNTDEHYYNYDNAKLVYSCGHCGGEVLD